MTYNRYAYANNNPYKYTDPNGEIPLAVWGIYVGVQAALTAYDSYKAYQEGGATALAKQAAVDIALSAAGAKLAAKAAEGAVAGAKALDAVKDPLARGRAAEQRVLDDLGLPKNTEKVETSEGRSVPDALTNSQSIEIKDCISVSCTKQIRIQTEAASTSERQSVLVTGTKTRVSGPARRAFDDIIRRDDLGPQ
jgi:hypothetical protein